MCVYGRIIAKPHFSVFYPCPLMRQKFSIDTQHCYEEKFRLPEPCESNAHKGLVREVGLDEERSLSGNQEKKAVQKGSWVRQRPDR